MQQWPELVNYASSDDLMPVSSYVLKQMRFKADRFSNRGIPILMRGFRTIIQEEMLNSALDSIADRLYTPLILTKLGATAPDLGTNVPWIPTSEEMEEFNATLDAALAADFRALTYHWAIDMEPVFGRENVPDLTNDFDRIVERILMVFGLSQTMLTGASAGETYAADALNRDVVTQLLSHYQKMIARFVHDRCAIVAEAQEHFDYEVRQGKRYLITEEIYEVDEESGEERVVEQPKLLIPEHDLQDPQHLRRGGRAAVRRDARRGRRADPLPGPAGHHRHRLRRGDRAAQFPRTCSSRWPSRTPARRPSRRCSAPACRSPRTWPPTSPPRRSSPAWSPSWGWTAGTRCSTRWVWVDRRTCRRWRPPTRTWRTTRAPRTPTPSPPIRTRTALRARRRGRLPRPTRRVG